MNVRHAIIAGDHVDVAEVFVVTDPATGNPLAEVSQCGPAEVDDAITAAEHAAPAWRRAGPQKRSELLQRLAALIRNEADALALLESEDTGKPIRQAAADVAIAARYFQFYGNLAEALDGRTIATSSDVFAYTIPEPYGVTGHIIPWNYPIQIASRTIAPALATGNCCVLKPAEEAPLTPLRLGELALEAGFPPGTLNVVPGLGEEAGAAIAAHPRIAHLSFTGSAEVGRLVGRAAADNCVPVTLELGGKSPNIVFADADIEVAIPLIVNSILQNAGQTCSAGSRLLVEQPIYERVVGLVAEAFRTTRLGPGREDPDLGPLISSAQRDRVQAYVDAGKRTARLVVGGDAPSEARLAAGYYWLPTLFDDVSRDALIAQEEIFGPVVAATSFADVEEALSLAESTNYGLIAAIWTNNVHHAHSIARELRVGQVFVNSYGAGGRVELPFGGFKQSGHGREKGFEALETYTQPKTVAIQLR
jgi:aldehyde dehydrogenase (NAD+)